MHSSMQQIFYPPNQHELSSIYYGPPPSLVHSFTKYLSFEPAQHFLLAMNNTHIYVYDSQTNTVPKLCTPFDFSLKFEIIRQQWKDQFTPGKPIGIIFEKDNCQSVTLYSNSVAVDAWRVKLQEKINQRGFHKLFKAKRKIGKGAFATVYLAERLLDKKLVAVKAFSKQRQYAGDKGKDSLINQISLMRKLKNHSNVISLEGIYETDNSIYVILQNLQGGQLHQKIKTGVKFTLYEITQIMKSILKGLAHMDSHRIIHRDLKPQNLLFRTKDSLQLVIADFGLATWAEEPIYLFVRCGTPGFVAPQIINIKDMSTHSDPISDVFSAGLIFHYLLLGKSAFKGVKYAQILAQNRSCDFKLTGSQYQELDKNAYDLLIKMLEINPNYRIRAHQALTHAIFKQCMDIEPQENFIEISNNNILTFTKQTKITGLFDSPFTIKNKQNLNLTKRGSQLKKKRQNIILNNNNILQPKNHQEFNNNA